MGGKGSGRPTNEEALVRSLSVQKQNPIASDTFLPNLSGDFSHGRVLTTPTDDNDPVNKKYVDDAIAAIPGGGDVTAAVNLTANTITQGDDGAKGIKTSTATVAQIASNVTHTAGDGSDHADVATNTTHRTSDGTDHSDVVDNTALAHTHTPVSSVYLSANQLNLATGYTKILLSTADFDVGSIFNTTTKRFEITQSGYYQVNGFIHIQALIANEGVGVFVYRNGSGKIMGAFDYVNTGRTDIAMSVSGIVYVLAGEYLELYSYHPTTATARAYGSSNAWGCRMSVALIKEA